MSRRARRERQQRSHEQRSIAGGPFPAPYAPGGAGFTPPPSWPVSWWQQGFRLPQMGGSAAVEACISAIAQAVAQLPCDHWLSKPNGGRELVTTSAASRIMRKPNRWQSRADFILNLLRTELYTGNGYALATRNARFEIDALTLADHGAVEPRRDPETGDVFYQVSTSNGWVPPAPLPSGLWPQRDVLHMRMHTPRDSLVGVTPLSNAAQAVETGAHINEGVGAFMANMVRPSGYLEVPPNVSMQAGAVDTLRQNWADHASGANRGRMGVLTHGVSWHQLKMDAFDEAVVAAYKMTVADIARVFRVPLPIIGELGGATFSNAETLIRHWHATGLGFVIEHLELALGDLFGLPRDEYVEFDVEYILRSDFQARMDGLAKAVTGSIMSPNEARRREGLPSVEGGDAPRAQAQLVPLSAADAIGSVPAAPSAPAAPVNDPPKDDDEEPTKAVTVPFDAARAQARLAAVWREHAR